MVHVDGPVGLDGVGVRFADERAVADAGIVVVATLAGRLGIEALVDGRVALGDRAGAGNEGAKVMTLLSAMALGADCIEDCGLLRSGRTGDVLGHRVVAPSTLGTSLRSFTFGHVRQLDRVLGETIERAWAAGAGPGDRRLVIDVDSFVGETFGPASRAPRSATPVSVATTRFSPLAPTPAKCCTSGCARDQRTPRAAPAASSTN